MSRVICAGHVNWDVTLRLDRLPGPDDEAAVESRSAAGGGSAANVAATLAGLDVPVSLLGSVGDDDSGTRARAELTAAGVDCQYLVEVADARTTTKYVLVDEGGETAVLGRTGANEAFGADDLPDAALGRAEHLHLTGQDPVTAARLAERAGERGVAVSVDPGRRIGDREFGPVFALADLVFVNEREAGALGDVPAPTVVRKRGSDGAEAHTPGGTHSHGGVPVDPVDTTGAGDAFTAGFLAARLDGESLGRALAVGNACGALAAETRGARADIDAEAVAELLGE